MICTKMRSLHHWYYQYQDLRTNTTIIFRGHLTGCMSHVTIRPSVCINSVVNCGLIRRTVQCTVVIVADLYRGLHHCMLLVPMYKILETHSFICFLACCTDQKLQWWFCNNEKQWTLALPCYWLHPEMEQNDTKMCTIGEITLCTMSVQWHHSSWSFGGW